MLRAFISLLSCAGIALAVDECVELKEGNTSTLTCPPGEPQQHIFRVIFADFGTETGNCSTGFNANPSCTTFNHSMALARQLCLGQASCVLDSTNDVWGPDPCPGVPKALAVQVECDSGDHCYDISFNDTFGEGGEVVQF